MPQYVDGFVISIPNKNVKDYIAMAKRGGKIWKKHGALEYYECIAEDLKPHMGGMKALTFPKLTKLKKGETVVFSFIVFRSRAHRDSVNAKVMADPSMHDPQFINKPMPFDMKHMAYGGFEVVVKS